MWRFRSAVSICLIAYGCMAQATLLTIEPDDYAAGTIIGPTEHASLSFMSHAYLSPEFTFRVAMAAFDPTCSIYTTTCAPPTGTHVLSSGELVNGQLQPEHTYNLYDGVGFLNPPEGTTIEVLPPFLALRVDFATPTDFFSADLYNNSGDVPSIMAFDSRGDLIARIRGGTKERRQFGPVCDNQNPWWCGTWEQSVAVQRDQADIAFVLVGSSGASGVVDAVRFNVPEPSSLILLGIGLAAMLSGVRRRRHPGSIVFHGPTLAT